MTVITLVAIAAIGALFYIFVWPMIQRTIVQKTCETYGTNYKATEASGGVCGTDCVETSTKQNSNDEKVAEWCCCPSSK